jgi:FkbM family methyltransferase
MKFSLMLKRTWHLWKTRQFYATTPGFLLVFWDKILSAKPRWPLPGRGQVYRLQLAGDPRPFSLRRGTSDLIVLLEIFAKGEYAPAVERLKGDCRTVVDLGANAGFSIRQWADSFPDCTIYAAEMDSENAMACRKNIELAGITHRVILTEVCLVGKKRQVFIDRSGGNCGVHATDTAAGGAAIMGTTMEEFLESAGVPQQIDLLKCDIEGGESEIFKNCAGWINRCRVIVAETHTPYNVDELLQDIKNAGGSIREFRRYGKNIDAYQLVMVELGAKAVQCQSADADAYPQADAR